MKKVIIILAVAIVALLSVQDASANHYAAEAHRFNLESQPKDTGTIGQWVINGTPLNYCMDYGGADRITMENATVAAISYWSAVDFGLSQEFQYVSGNNCQSNGVIFTNSTSYSNPCPDGSGAVGCTVRLSQVNDIYRGGRYTRGLQVYINDNNFSFSYSGYRATIAHEIGHIFGLSEAYRESDRSCVTPALTIMNAAGAGSPIGYNCVGLRDPSSSDITKAENLYNNTYFYHDLFAVAQPGGRDMFTYWTEGDPGEYGYIVDVEYLSPITWQWTPYGSWWALYRSAEGDEWGEVQLSSAFHKPALVGTNWWRSCVNTVEIGGGDKVHRNCTPGQYLWWP